MMMVTLNNLAVNYKMLPSEALMRASTFDLKVLDISTKWEKRKVELAESKIPGKSTPKLTEQEMLDMIKRAREK